MNEFSARLLLFNAIEPGSQFWGKYISEFGALDTYKKIISEYKFPVEIKCNLIKEKLLCLNPKDLESEISKAEADFLTPENQFWPQQFSDLPNPPIGLIAKGNLDNLKTIANAVSIVGTRNPTSYGTRIAEEFSAAFADRDFAVISGGAYGIDASAHHGAIAASGITVAVLASGINKSYPAGNQRLFSQILKDGLLISELMPNEVAMPFRFLVRNRLIAALGKATIVIEAAARSGSIRTATDAAQIFRPVFAVPGRISSAQSDGCHRLIADHVAEIVTGVDDVINLLSPMQPLLDETMTQ